MDRKILIRRNCDDIIFNFSKKKNPYELKYSDVGTFGIQES